MTIYADILVIVNLYIDFFLLWCVKKFFAFRASGLRLALGTLVGGLCSLTSLLPRPVPLLSLALGLATALAVTAAAFCPLPPKAFCRAAAGFWGLALLLAGLFLFLLRFFAPGNIAVLGSVVYLDLSPLLLFSFTCCAYLLFTLAGKLLPGGSSTAAISPMTVEAGGAAVTLWAKADTGNELREPFSGLPVIVCQAEKLQSVLPGPVREFLRNAPPESVSSPTGGIRLIPFESLGGSGLLPAFRPERVTLEKTGASLDCWIAVSAKKLSAGQFDALYDPNQFENAT